MSEDSDDGQAAENENKTKGKGKKRKSKAVPLCLGCSWSSKRKGSLLEWIRELPANQLTPEVLNVLNAIQNCL